MQEWSGDLRRRLAGGRGGGRSPSKMPCFFASEIAGLRETDVPRPTRGRNAHACSQRKMKRATNNRTKQQKKKVSDLGELPALDWSNASAKLLVTAIVTGILLLTLYTGWMDEGVQMGQFFLREWLNGLCVAVGAYFIIELMAKVRAESVLFLSFRGCVAGLVASVRVPFRVGRKEFRCLCASHNRTVHE